MENLIRWFEAARGESSPDLLSTMDYCRKGTGLASFPTLVTCLRSCKGTRAKVLMDDIRRLFAICEPGCRQDPLTDLIDYGDHLVGLRQDLYNTAVQKDMSHFLKCNRPIRYRYGNIVSLLSEEDRRAQTARATARSGANRGLLADRMADTLVELREELMAAEGSAHSHRRLADIANDRGLRTTRGNQWTRATVARVLKRRLR
jgi:hypothetical protein